MADVDDELLADAERPGALRPLSTALPPSVRPARDPAPAQEPVCTSCGGAGFFRQDVPVGHPDFGKLLPCHCTLQAQLTRHHTGLATLSNLEFFTGQTFATFDPRIPGVQA